MVNEELSQFFENVNSGKSNVSGTNNFAFPTSSRNMDPHFLQSSVYNCIRYPLNKEGKVRIKKDSEFNFSGEINLSKKSLSYQIDSRFQEDLSIRNEDIKGNREKEIPNRIKKSSSVMKTQKLRSRARNSLLSNNNTLHYENSLYFHPKDPSYYPHFCQIQERNKINVSKRRRSQISMQSENFHKSKTGFGYLKSGEKRCPKDERFAHHFYHDPFF